MKHKNWVKIFKALGNENRIKILELIRAQKELPVFEIAEQIKLSAKSTSKHVIILKYAGFLESDRKSGGAYYSLNQDMPEEVKDIFKKII